MKRTEINKSIDDAIAFFAKMNFALPAWSRWTPEEWATKGDECREICETRIGWDVTDFGSGDFKSVGRTIFTLRNGNSLKSDLYPKSYAHKAMYMLEDQKSPIHYHKSKREDICCAGGGVVAIRLWQATEDNSLMDKPFNVAIDGIRRLVTPGEELYLEPGQSVCVNPRTYHQFYALKGRGTCLTVEVSSTCNDLTDNFWYKKQERFPPIEEDEPRRYVLCSEYSQG